MVLLQESGAQHVAQQGCVHVGVCWGQHARGVWAHVKYVVQCTSGVAWSDS